MRNGSAAKTVPASERSRPSTRMSFSTNGSTARAEQTCSATARATGGAAKRTKSAGGGRGPKERSGRKANDGADGLANERGDPWNRALETQQARHVVVERQGDHHQ